MYCPRPQLPIISTNYQTPGQYGHTWTYPKYPKVSCTYKYILSPSLYLKKSVRTVRKEYGNIQFPSYYSKLNFHFIFFQIVDLDLFLVTSSTEKMCHAVIWLKWGYKYAFDFEVINISYFKNKLLLAEWSVDLMYLYFLQWHSKLNQPFLCPSNIII